jgi:deoxyadenosine/deoxycytidine kinase
MNKFIVSIEGNIGSGKSTLIKILNNNSNHKNVVFVDEPVNEWSEIVDNNGKNILTKFYEDQEKYSFSFQMMAYISRLNKLRQALNSGSNYIITERSLTTDKYVFAKMLYDTGKMDTCEYQIYNNWFDSFNQDTEVTHIIYVRTDPIVCSDRIKIRSRRGENIIGEDYLNDCHVYHENMINELRKKNIPVLELNGNLNVFNEDVVDTWMESIDNFVLSTEEFELGDSC